MQMHASYTPLDHRALVRSLSLLAGMVCIDRTNQQASLAFGCFTFHANVLLSKVFDMHKVNICPFSRQGRRSKKRCHLAFVFDVLQQSTVYTKHIPGHGVGGLYLKFLVDDFFLGPFHMTTGKKTDRNVPRNLVYMFSVKKSSQKEV
jgi:hypothetical protein